MVNRSEHFVGKTRDRVASSDDETLSTDGDSGGMFISNVSKLVFGTSGGQVITMLASPFLTRLFMPESFGVSALFGSLLQYCLVIATLRYELAIVLPKSDDEAGNVAYLTMILVVIFTAVCSVAIHCFGSSIALRLGMLEVFDYLWLLPLFILIGGVVRILTYWSIRKEQFGLLSLYNTVKPIGTVGGKLGLGLLNFNGAAGLIMGNLFGSLVGVMVLVIRAISASAQNIERPHHFIVPQRLWNTAIRYHKFPLYEVPNFLINNVFVSLPIFVLTSMFSSRVSGWYALASRTAFLPISFVGTAVSQVYLQKSADAYSNGELSAVVDRTFRQMVAVGVFPILLLAVVSGDLFPFVFGSEWLEAGVYVQILSFSIFFAFVSAPLIQTFRVFEKQELALLSTIALIVFGAPALLIGAYLESPRLAILLWSLAWGCIRFGVLLIVLKLSGLALSKALRYYIRYLLQACALMTISGVPVVWFFNGDEWLKMGATTFALLLYVSLVLRKEVPQIQRLLEKPFGIVRKMDI